MRCGVQESIQLSSVPRGRETSSVTLSRELVRYVVRSQSRNRLTRDPLRFWNWDASRSSSMVHCSSIINSTGGFRTVLQYNLFRAVPEANIRQTHCGRTLARESTEKLWEAQSLETPTVTEQFITTAEVLCNSQSRRPSFNWDRIKRDQSNLSLVCAKDTDSRTSSSTFD